MTKSRTFTIYNALDGPNWANSENWLTDAPLGEWSGVQTDDNGRVIYLQMGASGSGKELSGEIPLELIDLGALEVLVDAVIREQGSLPFEQRRGALVVVDEMQSMPGVDYESMLSELGKFGASFVLAGPRWRRFTGGDST